MALLQHSSWAWDRSLWSLCLSMCVSDFKIRPTGRSGLAVIPVYTSTSHQSKNTKFHCKPFI